MITSILATISFGPRQVTATFEVIEKDGRHFIILADHGLGADRLLTNLGAPAPLQGLLPYQYDQLAQACRVVTQKDKYPSRCPICIPPSRVSQISSALPLSHY